MSQKKRGNKGPRWFKVSGTVTVSAYQYVRATSATEAKRKTNLSEGALCPYGPERSGASPLEQPIIEEADGTFVPTDATEEDPDPMWLEEDNDEEEDDDG